jgi:Icc-related predicted phosphoesterase
MTQCFFVSDLHGHFQRYRVLFEQVIKEKPAAVFLGGDLLPSGVLRSGLHQIPIQDFMTDFFVPELQHLQSSMGTDYPRFFVIPGNDDPKSIETDLVNGEANGLWEYIHCKKVEFIEFSIFGYARVPPTPFLLKDWESYDISRYLEPGCIAPEDGWHSVPIPSNEAQYGTIQEDLRNLVAEEALSNAIFLFHSPPYQTNLDRAALDGKFIDHVPVDVHVGSIAIRRFIENHQPLLTLHGHIHESPRLTGKWEERIGQTFAFSAAHDGPELALVRFDPYHLGDATRQLLDC